MKSKSIFFLFLFLLSHFSLPPVGQGQEKGKILPYGEIQKCLFRAARWENQKKYGKALALYLTALRSFQHHQAPPKVKNGNLAGAHLKVADCYGELGKAEKALFHYRRAEARAKKAFPQPHVYFFHIYGNASAACRKLGKMKEATTLCQKALQTIQALYSPPHLKIAMAWNQMGSLCLEKGELKKALQYFQKGYDQRKKLLSSPHLLLATSHNNLGGTYLKLGQYSRAQTHLKKALAIHQKLHQYHPELGNSHETYALLLSDLGQYQEAMAHYRKALKQYRKFHNPPHFLLWRIYSHLGNLYGRLKRISEAKKSFQKALGQALDLYTPPHRHLVNLYNNLASIFIEEKKYQGALDLLKKALKQQRQLEKVTGEERAVLLIKIGKIYRQCGHLHKATHIFQEAQKVAEKTFSSPHRHLAGLYNEIALLLDQKKKYNQALHFLDKALLEMKSLTQLPHPALAFQWETRAQILRAMGRYQESAQSLQKGWEIMWKSFRRQWPLLSTSNKISQVREYFIAFYAGILSLCAENPTEKNLKWGWETAIFYKEILNLILDRERKLARILDDRQLKKLKVRYKKTLRQLNQLAYLPQPATFSQREKLKKKVKKLEADKGELERQISARSEDFRDLHKISFPRFDQVQSRIPPQVLLLEYAEFYHFEKGKNTLGVFAMTSNSLRFYLLGDSTVLKEEVSRVVKAVQRPGRWLSLRREEQKKRLVKEEKNFIRQARGLWEKLFPPPLRQAFHQGDLILLAPDSFLHYLPFGILPTGNSLSTPYLAERKYHLYLSSGRELLSTFPEKNPGLYGVAHPKYSLSSQAKREKLARQLSPREGSRDFLRGQSRHQWESLPGTAQEIQGVTSWYKLSFPRESTLVHTGPDALESLFLKEAPGRGWIHIATHGFFFDREKSSTSPVGKRLLGRNLRLHPLLRAGLVLSGANSRPVTGPFADDGYLTASDISLLDLRGTECVVLSACETARGKLESGVGVYSLKWAFSQGGARYLAASLWKIPDEETSQLMERFYSSLSPKKPAWKSFLEGQRQFISSQREKKTGRSHPYFWGAFVFQGNPLPVKKSHLTAPPPPAKKAPPLGDRSSGWIWWAMVLALLLLAAATGGLAVYHVQNSQ